MGYLLDVLMQLQLRCAPCHRLTPAHFLISLLLITLLLFLFRFLPSDPFLLGSLLILSIQVCQITALISVD